ncbi:mechanosensitive ion channel family protein [Borrelia hermsii]|uniref:Mechanosensitive ion channel n=3 Tax=Borrelia hermsii TaxID=140 RepID=A0AAN0X597_BORHE|nr:mechanosensitive ion channel family protein [Borrelia hermsii]AAX16962.1 mechanosensitive ion channel [Borrelia hermsii DAH]AJW73255.1 mechanosensitive ion channel protein [Borrelia hermsii CC1]AMR75391.1 Mechanosensitive ion channel [Borrelia hermsii]ANA43260.1 mechanosensitive ion channel protein [Borrelia hermsii HS1]UCP01467.1 mechanosensitive ion channel family protein [Borrelia hermsii]
MNEQLGTLNLFKEISIFQDYINTIFETVLGYGLKVLVALLVWYILRFVIKRMGKFFFKAFEKSKLETKLDSTVLNFFKSFFAVMTDMVLILVILPYLGVPTTSVFAIFGSLGLAVGLAAQGILSNFVSGFIVLNSNFFKIGDHISCDDVEGEVNDIQIFFTTLKTVDGKIIKIPNSKFTSTSVTNFSANPKRRIAFSFQVPYDTDIDVLKSKIENLAFSVNREQYGVKDPSVIVKEYTPYYVVMQVRCFVKTEFFWDFQYFIAENIKGILSDMGIKFPIHIVDFSKLH